MAKIFDEYGRLIQIKEEDKEIWRADNNVKRDKISEDSKRELDEAIQNGDTDLFMRRVFEILTGQTPTEFRSSTE